MNPTQVAVCHTALSNAQEAGDFLAHAISGKLNGAIPDVVILFASPAYPYEELLKAVDSACRPKLMVGCSSAGEFSGCTTGNASASVMAIVSDDILFSAAIGRQLRASQTSAVQSLLPSLKGHARPDFPFRSALVLTDALAGYVDELIHELTVKTGGIYQLFGGGAGDDAKFHRTHVFYGTEAVEDAVIVLEMLSKKPIGIGVKHGWKPHGKPLRVTEAQGNRVISLNSMSAVEAFEAHAESLGVSFDRSDPQPFFMHNVIGIDVGDGYKIRVPLALDAEGAIICAAEVPEGATVSIMATSIGSSCEAAREAAQAAAKGLQGAKLAGSLVFDCAATRIRMGSSFGDELKSVAEALGSDNYAGCNTYGQIARADGQFSGFHNCTAIVCAIPE